jgi:hypothetical protein
MRKVRFSIGGIMAVVLVLAVGLAALKSASDVWAGVVLMLTYGVLSLAIVGVLCCRDAERVWWIGFAVFGWGYIRSAAGWFSPFPLGNLPTVSLMHWLSAQLGVVHEPDFQHLTTSETVGFNQISNCLWAMLFGILGGVLARAFFAVASARPAHSDPAMREPDQALPPPSHGPAILVLAGLVLLGSNVWIWTRSDSVLWAGGLYLLTCGLLGVAILGATFGRGKRREICIGIALFGSGYLYIALVHTRSAYFERPRPYLITDQFLQALRSRISRSFRGAASDGRVLRALEQPVPMPFPDDIELRDLLSYIKQATSTPTDPELPIYVDPLGLQEAERSLDSTVQIDLKGVPLRTTLRYCLNQLDLAYIVEDGCLKITSETMFDAPESDDPFMIVGHCLLAWVAALIGGVTARWSPPRAASGRVRSSPKTRLRRLVDRTTPGKSRLRPASGRI